jgi:hypothetical protein
MLSPENHLFANPTRVTEIVPAQVSVDDSSAELRHLSRDAARKLEVVVDSELHDRNVLPVEEIEGSDVAIVRVDMDHVSVNGIQEALAAHNKELGHAA